MKSTFNAYRNSSDAQNDTNGQDVELREDFDEYISYSPEMVAEDDDAAGTDLQYDDCDIRKMLSNILELNKNMAKKLDRVESSNTVLVHEFSKLSATHKSLVSAITGQKVPEMDDMFPIKTLADVEKIVLLSQSSEDFPLKLNIFLKYLKSPSSKDISTAFKEIVSDEFLEEYNWEGQKQQGALRRIKFFNVTLFDAWRTEEFTKDVYIEAVRKEIRKSHDRVAQRKAGTKRQRILDNELF